MNICFVGLGKLGLPLAGILASCGNKVFCLDKNEIILDKLSKGELPFYEAGLDTLLEEHSRNILGYTDSYKEGVLETEAAVILVNTQLGDHGYSSDFVQSAISDIAINLKYSNKEYYTIVLSSTVLPGTIIGDLIPLVEKISGRTHGEGFGFSYVPDFVKLGSVIEDFRNPEFFIIGANNNRDFEITRSIFNGVRKNDAQTFKMTLEETEVAKVALNAYIVNKITFANFLGMMCGGMDNVNVHNVTKVIGLDKRISPHFFKSGAPYGGTCFPRDATAFIKFAKDRGLTAKNLIFAEEVNSQLQDTIYTKCKPYDKVGVLGVSFKPTSPVTIGSPSKALIDNLLKDEKKVYIYDKLPEACHNLGMGANVCESVEECVSSSDIIVIMHPDKDFGISSFDEKEVIDPWGVLDLDKKEIK